MIFALGSNASALLQTINLFPRQMKPNTIILFSSSDEKRAVPPSIKILLRYLNLSYQKYYFFDERSLRCDPHKGRPYFNYIICLLFIPTFAHIYAKYGPSRGSPQFNSSFSLQIFSAHFFLHSFSGLKWGDCLFELVGCCFQILSWEFWTFC